MAPDGVFAGDFPEAIRLFVSLHHQLYPVIPPRDIYFESLVENAFRRIKKPFTPIESGGRNQPRHDLEVEGHKLSIKTETGYGTKPATITITKLCTTEREPWTATTLVERVMEHLDRYDLIVMLRAIWKRPLIHYQLLEIPVSLLKKITAAEFHEVGRRRGRQSLGADVKEGGEKLFHVHFDASDGKCSIRGLQVKHCAMLLEWDFDTRSQ
jgi:type II restriction enzyme